MMYHRLYRRYAVLIIFLILPLLLINLLPSAQPSFIKDAYLTSYIHPDVSCTTIAAGGFFTIKLDLTSQASKITVIAYKGDVVPDKTNRSILNYYCWQYDHGTWRDLSGYKKTYIKPEKCYNKGETYVFCIGFDGKAEQGQWKIKISVDNKEAEIFPVTIKPTLPLLISGTTAVEQLNKKNSLLNLLLKKPSNKKLEKIVSMLKKEDKVKAAYINKRTLNGLSILLLFDSQTTSLEATRIIEQTLKKTRHIFQHTPVNVVSLNNLPFEEAHHMLMTHRLFYQKNLDDVKRFEHDVVAEYLDKKINKTMVTNFNKHNNVEKKTLLSEVEMISDLCRLDDLTPSHADVLIDAGFRSLKELSEGDPSTIFKVFSDKERLPNIGVTMECVEGWVDSAKTLIEQEKSQYWVDSPKYLNRE